MKRKQVKKSEPLTSTVKLPVSHPQGASAGPTARNRKGQDKAQARTTGVKMGLGLAIAKALDDAGKTLRTKLLALIGETQATVAKAIEEVKAHRQTQSDWWRSKREQYKEKKDWDHHARASAQVRSIAAAYSRCLTIMQAIHDGTNLERIKKAGSLSEMYGWSVKAEHKKAERFNAEKILQRIVKPAGENESKQVARVEQIYTQCLAFLGKHSLATTVPVQEVMALSMTKGRKARKAA